MVRNFRPDPVAPELIDQVLDLARHGPSAGFTQGQDFIVVTDSRLKHELAEICHESNYVKAGFHRFVSEAPVLIVPCTNEAAYHRRYQESDKLGDQGNEIDWPVPYWYMDIGCAVMTILLGVVDLGLAAGFVGAPQLSELRAALEIPDEVDPMGVIPIGYPAEDKRSPSIKRGRRDRREVIHHQKWTQHA
jgi:nitroreductase